MRRQKAVYLPWSHADTTDILEPPREGPPREPQAHKVRIGIYYWETHRSLPSGRQDDEIYEHFKRDFPEMFVEPYERITKLDEDMMKSKDGKEKWRKFIET